MEVKLKEKLKTNSKFGTIENVEKFYLSVIKKLSMKTSEAAIARSKAYEISEAYKINKIEFELKRAQAYAEAHRQRLRLL